MTTRPGYVWDATASEWVEIGQAAVLAPIKYQTSQPSSPATGDIWIDSDDEVPSVDSTLYYRWTKTMSGGETSLSGTDNNSLALKYTPGYESVFINGVLQVRGSDYVATTGTTVTGLTALTASDVVMVESIIAYSVGDTYTQSQVGSLLDAKSPVSTTGLVLLNTTNFTSANTIDLLSLFNSSYTNYQINVDITSASATDSLFLYFLSGSTPASGSYWHAFTGFNYSGGASNISGNGVSYGHTGFNFTATSYTAFSLNIFNPNVAQKTKWFGTGIYDDSGRAGGGFNNQSTAYDGIRFVANGSKTITGTIKVYGYK